MNSPRKLILNLVLIASVLLFVFSLKYDSYCTAMGCINSAEVFGTGWFGASVELGALANFITEELSKHHSAFDTRMGAALIWFANPLLFISWIGILRWPRGSLVFSTLAMIVSLTFLSFNYVLHNDIGHYSKLLNFQPGYWLWVSSATVMVVGNVVMKFLPLASHHIQVKSSRPFIPE
jgi:hypothetical protein